MKSQEENCLSIQVKCHSVKCLSVRAEMFKYLKYFLQLFKIFRVILVHSLLQEGPYFNHLAQWVVEVMLNEKSISGNIPLSHFPVTTATGNLINIIKSLNECDTEQFINDLFDTADGFAFEQTTNSSDWDPDQPVMSSNKATLVNMLLYKEAVLRRGKKV